MKAARGGRAAGAYRRPTVARRIVAASVVQSAAAVDSAPNNHIAARPYCRVSETRGGWRAVGGGRWRWHPIVEHRIITGAIVEVAGAAASTPDDHLAPCPHRCIMAALVGVS